MKFVAATPFARTAQRGLRVLVLVALVVQLILPVLSFPAGALAEEAASDPAAQTADTTPPDLTVPDDIVVTADPGADQAVVDFGVSAADDVDDAIDPDCDASSGDAFPLGTTTVSCSATDAAGNTASDSFDVTVERAPDTTAPVIENVPTDIEVVADDDSGAAVTYSQPTASDDVDGAVDVVCDPVSGSHFSLGSTTVICTAVDSSDNAADATFTVTVDPAPTAVPTDTPAPAPTDTPAPTATDTPAPEPTSTPTEEPTNTPTTIPTKTITGPPTIKSDKEDYGPGDVVTLNGRNWQPGETVHIYVNDDKGSSWSRNVDVVADENGAITDTFNLPNWFVALYRVVATGPDSGTVTTTFTDANLKVQASFGGAPNTIAITYTRYSGTNCTGNAKDGTPQTLSPVGTSPVTVPQANQNSTFLTADATSGGLQFLNWTDNGVIVSGVKTVCANYPATGSDSTWTANYEPNHPPAVTRNNATLSVTEGQTATNSGSWSDDNPFDTVSITASSGTITQTGTSNSGTWSWSFGTTDGPDQSRTVTITANDGHTTTTTTFSLAVNNVAPTVTLAAANDLSVNEGPTTHTYSYAISDPGSDTVTSVTTTCGANGTKVAASDSNTDTSGSFQCSFPDGPSSSIVSAQATDSDGAAGNTATQTVTINNVVPTATLANNGPINEGGNAIVTFSGQSDPSSVDTTAGFHYAYSCTNGDLSGATYANSTADGAPKQCAFSDNGTFTVKGRIIDKDDGFTERTTNVTVNNVAPVVTAPANQTATEGVSKSFTLGSFTDPGADSPWVVTVDWGDGSSDTTFNQSTTGTITAQMHTFVTTGTKTVTVTVKDKDTATGSASFSVAVASSNQAPVASDGTATTNEDIATSITLSATDADGNTLIYSIVAGPSHGSLGPVSGNAVTYTPAGDYSGSDSFTFKANDGTVDSNTATVSITVNPVNDAPSFTKGADQTINEDAGPQTATGWATNISAGPNENTQSVDFIVSNDNTALFSAQPAVSPNGTLTYTPAANANGSATVTVKIHDDGSTANGGVDTSAAQTFTITVTAVNDKPVPANDTASTPEDSTLYLLQSVLTSNDSRGAADESGQTLTVSEVSGSVHGTVSIVAAGDTDATENVGKIRFVPETDFNGLASFAYKVCDNGSPQECSVGTATVTVTVTEVNDAPTAVNDLASAAEDGTVSLDPRTNDSTGPANESTQTLTVTAVGTAGHGTAELIEDGPDAGKIRYTPATNYNGADSFTYTIEDNGTTNGLADPKTSTATVNVTVNAVNDAPVASDGSATTAEDTAKNITLVATDVDGDGLTYSIVSGPTHGSLTGTGANHTYTPALNYNGSDSFTFKVSDGSLGSNVATVSITVDPVNDAPVANAQSVTTDEDTPKAITLTGSDVEGSVLAFTVESGPSHGTLTGTVPNLTYNPAANYHGSDSFTFKANDGSLYSALATVSITVDPVNDAPVAGTVAATDPAYRNSTITAVYDGFSDPDGDTLNYSYRWYRNGTLVSGQTTFTYSGGQARGDTIQAVITASDGELTASADDSVTLGNRAPVADDQDMTTDEDADADITLTGGDPDDDSLTYAVVATPAHGTLSGAGANLSYTPDTDFNGSDSFTFTVNDGVATSDPATVSITVDPVNDAPVANGDTAQTDEDTDVTIEVLTNDTTGPATAQDEASQTLSVTVVAEPAHGTVVVNGDGTVTYTPALNYHGLDTFTYTVTDSAGATATAVAVVDVDVTAVNDAPVAADDEATTDEDVAVTVALLVNDHDVDGDPLAVTVAGTANPDGTVTVSNGTVTVNANGTVTFAPTADFNGTTSFDYMLSDGSLDSNVATVSITVTTVNDAPDAADDSTTVSEDSGANAIGVLANDTDVDGDALSVTAVTQGAHGTVTFSAAGVAYAPNADYFGPDSFSYTVGDGRGGTDTATVDVTVTNVNDDPVANDDAATVAEDSGATLIGVLANDTDGVDEGETLSVIAVGTAAHGTAAFTATGVTYTPDADYNGPDSFTYTVGDGHGGSDTATVSITVTEVNDAPTAKADAVSTGEDSATTFAPWTNDLKGPANEGGQTLSVTAVTQGAHGTVVVNANGTVTYAPAANYNGSDSFTYTITDNGTTNGSADPKSDTATVTITVNEVNDDPDAADDTATVAEDGTVTFDPRSNDSKGPANESSQTLMVMSVGTAAHGTVTTDGSSVTYTPDPNFNGPDSFAYTITDNGTTIGAADPKGDPATVTVTVTEVNDAPDAVDDSTSVAEDGSVSFEPRTNDLKGPANEGGQALTVVSVTQGAHGAVAINTDGTLTYTPSADYNGPDSFSYTIEDNGTSFGFPNHKSATATVSITVTAVNDAPVAKDDTASTAEDTAAVINVLANDTDVDGDGLVVAPGSIVGPAHGTATVITSGPDAGRILYTPATNYYGPDSFSYRASDGSLNSNAATVSISVTAVNDAPVANAQSVSTPQDTPKAITLTGSDVEGSSLIYTIVSGPIHGTLSGTGANRTYTPDAFYYGSDSFTFKVNDGELDSAPATVSITVDKAAYSFEFLQPINYTAHQQAGVTPNTSLFKGGSTVPVKFVLKDAAGNVLPCSGTATWLGYAKGGAITGGVLESTYSEPASSGGAYSCSNGEYHYNWSTKGAQSGYYYRIGVKLANGAYYYVYIGLK